MPDTIRPLAFEMTTLTFEYSDGSRVVIDSASSFESRNTDRGGRYQIVCKAVVQITLALVSPSVLRFGDVPRP